MNAEELLRHYERVADAPEAISRLRRFVLDLAVRGRLVAQGPGDESAPLLLRRIEQAKHELIRSGQLRQPRDRDIGMELDKPFKLPSSWAWVRLDAVGAIIGGGTPPAGDAGNFADPGKGTPWLTPADLGGRKGLYVSRGARDLSEKGLRSSSATVMPTGSVLFTSRAPIGYVAIASNPVATNQGFKSVVPYLLECSRYVAMVLQAFAPEIDAKAPGTTFKEVSGKIVAGVPFPLPPLAEQHRIVAKVDELMALCDRLEAARAEREAARDRLTAASLARLNTPDPETFSEDARFVLGGLRPITTRSDQIKQLRLTILALAVSGNLTRQDPIDGDGSAAVGALKKARAQWESAGRIRKEKTASAPVSEDEKYLVLPASWTWVRLLDIGQTQTGTSPSSSNPDLFGDFMPFLKPGDLDGNSITYSGPGLSEVGVDHSRLAPAESVLMVCIGATLGKVNKTTRPACFNQQINAVTPFVDGIADYVAMAIKSQPFQALAWSRAGTGTLPIISKGKWEQLPIPFPPLAEQRRIVAKVDELMTVCDRLEASLLRAEDQRRRLLESLLHEALAREAVHEEAA